MICLYLLALLITLVEFPILVLRSHRDHDRMVVEFMTTCPISAYHH
jgi:hypothetical protein